MIFLRKNFNNVGILINSYCGQIRVIPKCVSCCNEISPGKIVLVYENTGGVELPAKVHKNVDKVVNTDMRTKSKHWINNSLAGMEYLSGFTEIEYVFTINGDCFIEKPHGFPVIFKKFVDSGSDIMCCYNDITVNGSCSHGTTSILSKKNSFNEVINSMILDFNRWDVLSCEKRLFFAVKSLSLNLEKVEPPDDLSFNINKNNGRKGTWMRFLGFVHDHTKYKRRVMQ